MSQRIKLVMLTYLKYIFFLIKEGFFLWYLLKFKFQVKLVSAVAHDNLMTFLLFHSELKRKTNTPNKYLKVLWVFKSKINTKIMMEKKNIYIPSEEKKSSLSYKTEKLHLLFHLRLLLRFSRGSYNLALILLLLSARNS